MAGLIVQGNAAKRLLPGVLKFFGWSYKDYNPEYTEIFEVMKSNKRFEEIVSMSGMGLAVVKNEGQGITYDDFQQHLTYRVSQVMYAKGFVISKEAMDDDQYAPKLAEIGAKFMAKSMKQTKETICANVLNNGFSSSYLGGDGVALFSASHVGRLSTFSNLLTAADLSEAALETATISISQAVDDAGLKLAAVPRKLIISSSDIYNARRILGNDDRPATSDRDINAMVSLGVLPEGTRVNHYLTDTDAWFIKTDVENGLMLVEREDQILEAMDDFDTKSSKFSVTERYAPFWGDPRAVYGNQGA